jgi:hypothetical protein
VLLAPFIVVRHVLLILPPLLIILGSLWNERLTGYSRAFGLAFSVIVSLGLCISDWSFANFFRTEADILGRSLPRSGTVWTSGHWGWQWYSTRAGMRQVDVQRSALRRGDLLVVAASTDNQALASPPPMHLVRTDKEGGAYQKVFCTGRWTGFYSHMNWGVPWRLSRTCQNWVDIFEVDGPSPSTR